MPAPSPESGSEPVAPRCSRLRRTVSACSTSAWLASPVRVATKPTPQASCSLRGSYIPCAAGRASMKDHFWPFSECWDGWRGVRIGSPVVVVVAYAWCRGTTLALWSAKFRAGYMMGRFSGTGYRVPTCGHRGARHGDRAAMEAMGVEADRSVSFDPWRGERCRSLAGAPRASLPTALTAHARWLSVRNQRVTATYAAHRIRARSPILRPHRTGCPGRTSHRPPHRPARAAATR